jgi:prepilin-type N-terminal cleavage/methylation domain-containing protein
MAADPASTRVAAPDDPLDRGFTLLETLVVVLLVAVVATVMVAVVAVIVRNAPSTEARVDNSNSYQRLIISLQRDAASTPPDEFKTLNTPPSPPAWSCFGISGPTLVQMSWSLEGSAYVAGYRLEADGSGKRINRYACSGPVGTSVLPNPTINHVTARLNDATPIEIVEGSKVVGVRIELTLCLQTDHGADCAQPDPGPPIAVEASSRNPAEALPPP